MLARHTACGSVGPHFRSKPSALLRHVACYVSYTPPCYSLPTLILFFAAMDGLSSAASVIAVVSIAVQLADSIKKLCEFWGSVQEAPEEIQNMKADLEPLSAVLSEIALDVQQHQIPDDTSTTVLNQYRSKVGILNAIIEKIEPHFALKSCRARTWSAIRTALKKKRLKKLHMTLEGLKTTLILVQQNQCQ